MASSDYGGVDRMVVIRRSLCFRVANAHQFVVGLLEPKKIDTDVLVVVVFLVINQHLRIYIRNLTRAPVTKNERAF